MKEILIVIKWVSGHNKIQAIPDNKEKTTFTYHLVEFFYNVLPLQVENLVA